VADATFQVVALAGGSLERDFREAGYKVANKAYLPIGGQLILERVLRAFRGSARIGHIRVVTPPDAFATAFAGREKLLCDDVVAPGEGLIDSLLAGCAGLAPQQMVIVSATDLALLTPTVVDSFAAVGGAIEGEFDIGYGFVSRDAHMARYPQVRHTWVRLKEGVFCGGGVSIMRAGAVAQVADLLRRVAALRKAPLRIAMLFSPLTLLRMLFADVSVAELEQRADELSGLRCRGVRCDEPELAVNVDRLSDLRTVERIIALSSQRTAR
jgi:GTP:adenosylcobinamide-phosphate guanylyltransferase